MKMKIKTSKRTLLFPKSFTYFCKSFYMNYVEGFPEQNRCGAPQSEADIVLCISQISFWEKNKVKFGTTFYHTTQVH